MAGRVSCYHMGIAAVALAAGLGLSGMAGPAAASSLKADFNGDGYDDLAVGVPEEEFGIGSGRGAVNVIYGSAKGLRAKNNQLWHQDVAGVEGTTGSFENFGAALASGDFDGDGYADLAVGVPNDHVGSLSWAGAVNVLYGSAAGLTTKGNQLWHKDSPGVPRAAETFDFFAMTLAAGDFDGDGRDDLAIGAPREAIGRHLSAGRVYVLYGTRKGLTGDGSQVWDQKGKKLPGRPRGLDGFGTSLAAGDFDDDGRDDLAIGVPFDFVKSGGTSFPAGAVHVLYGTRRGLTATGNDLWHSGVRGMAGAVDWGEMFGQALAVGDFDDDGRDDLAVGAPLDTVGGSPAGSVSVIFGSSGGLSASGSQNWHQNSKGIAGSSDLQDTFGVSLAAGDFDGNGNDDLAIGVPRETVNGSANAGAVNVLYGNGSGLSASGDKLWHQNKKGIADSAEQDDAFGQVIFAGDFDGNGKDDLVIGVPGEDIGAIADAGAVNLLYGTRRGLRAGGDQIWHQDSTGIQDDAELGDVFGLALP